MVTMILQGFCVIEIILCAAFMVGAIIGLIQ